MAARASHDRMQSAYLLGLGSKGSGCEQLAPAGGCAAAASGTAGCWAGCWVPGLDAGSEGSQATALCLLRHHISCQILSNAPNAVYEGC